MAEIINDTTSAGSTQTVTLSTVYKLKDLGEGTYELTEIPSDEFSPPEFDSGNRKTFSYPLPIPTAKVIGYVDFDAKEIGVYFTLVGAQVGPQLKAGLDTGFTYKLNLGVGSGDIHIFKDGKAIKLSYDLQIKIIKTTEHKDTVTLFNV